MASRLGLCRGLQFALLFIHRVFQRGYDAEMMRGTVVLKGLGMPDPEVSGPKAKDTAFFGSNKHLHIISADSHFTVA